MVTETRKFKVKAKTLEGVVLLFRNVVSYENRDGLVHFTDSKTGEPLAFPASDVNISVMEKDYKVVNLPNPQDITTPQELRKALRMAGKGEKHE